MDFGIFRADASAPVDVRRRDVPTNDVPDPENDVQEFDSPDPTDTPDPVDNPTPVDNPNVMMDAGDVPNADVPNAVDIPNVDRPNPVDIPTPNDVPNPCNGPVVINEVQTSGNGGGTDEWVELHNNGACEVSLNGWTLVYRSSSGVSSSTLYNFVAADRIAPNGELLVAGTGYMAANMGLRRFLGGGGLAMAAGGVGILNGATRVDSMVWGAVSAGHPFAEPLAPITAAAMVASGHSVARVPNGRDTDNNGMDFRDIAAPTPGTPNM